MELNLESTERIHSRFEAARELTRTVTHWFNLGERGVTYLSSLVVEVRKSYLAANESMRNAIETGFLEHVFEDRRSWILFESWKEDPSLRSAYDFAMEWATSRRV